MKLLLLQKFIDLITEFNKKKTIEEVLFIIRQLVVKFYIKFYIFSSVVSTYQ